MPVIYPRTDVVSTFTLITNSFDLQFQQEISRLRGGKSRARDLGPPIWKASYTSPTLGWDDCVDLESILKSLDGSIQTFLAHDTRRPLPRQYQSGGFSDTATISGVGPGGTTITLDNLPANFALSRGDRMSFEYVDGSDTYRALIEVMEPSAADGSGLTPALEIRPYVPLLATVSTPVTLINPSVLMNVDPNSVQYNNSGSALGTVSFSAQEVR